MNKIEYILYGFAFIFSYTIIAEQVQFLYPVASYTYENEEYIFLIYQKSNHYIELWQWNPTTLEAKKGLLSTFTPAGLRVMPEGTGFSFIDNDTVRVKFFNKRSPKSISFDRPVYNFSTIEWLDDETFYFSAQEYEKFSIFQGTIHGDITELVSSKTFDAMYPQKIGSLLFYIQRLAYEQKIVITDFDCNKTTLPEVIFSSETSNCGFLHMVTNNRGFFIEYAKDISAYDAILTCTYTMIEKTDESLWKTKQLFSFTLPLEYLLYPSYKRLYESILPLLPVCIGNNIYYMSVGVQNFTEIKRYDLECNRVQKIFPSVLDTPSSYFSPLYFNNKLYFGGELINSELDNHNNVQVRMWIDDAGLYFNLPYITL